MKYIVYCVIVTILAAFSVSAQFPQAERHRQKIEAGEKASAEKEKAEAANRHAYPPARMNVDVQMVLTDAERKDFAAAKDAAVTRVADGDPLWLYVKFNGALDRYVYRTKSPEGADRYILFFEMGPLGETAVNHHYIIDFEKADLSLTELKISLSPGAAGHLRAVPIFLRNAASLKPGLWRNEIRLTNRPALPRGAAEYLAKTGITCDLSKGTGKYQGSLKNYPSMIIRGSSDNARIPPPGKVSSFALRSDLMTELAAQRIKPLSIYFAGDGFIEYSDNPFSVRQVRAIYAVFTYTRGSNCFYGIAEMAQKYDPGTNNYNSPEITLQKDNPTPCGASK